jgi:hypothetical protein
MLWIRVNNGLIETRLEISSCMLGGQFLEWLRKTDSFSLKVLLHEFIG